MAFRKSIATPYGIDATYWHILSIDCNRVQRGLHVTMAGYADAAARSRGHRPLAVVGFPMDGADVAGTADGIRYADLYAAIRALAERPDAETPAGLFAGAADC